MAEDKNQVLEDARKYSALHPELFEQILQKGINLGEDDA